MIPPDKEPKLRVVDDLVTETEEVVRLQRGEKGDEPETEVVEVVPKVSLVAAKEVAERLEATTVGAFGGRSMEPGLEALADESVASENPEELWGGSLQKSVPVGWLALAGLVILGAISWSLWKAADGEAAIQKEEVKVVERLEKERRETAEAAEMVDEVERTLKAYFRAGSIEEMLPWVRDPQRVKPMMEDWMKRHPWKPREYMSMLMFQPTVLDGYPFWVIRVRFKNEEDEPVNLLLEQVGEKEVKVDWETQVRYQPLDWDVFCRERPTDRSLDFRVQAVPDHFYSFEFADSDQWSCYRLTAYGQDDYCFGYAKRGSEIDQKLQAMVRAALQEQITPMLRLRVPAATKAQRAVVIEDFLAPRWTILADSSKDSP